MWFKISAKINNKNRGVNTQAGTMGGWVDPSPGLRVLFFCFFLFLFLDEVGSVCRQQVHPSTSPPTGSV